MSSLLTPRQRDLSSRGLRALTAGAAFVSAAATGGVTALAAQASAEDAAAKAADAAAHAKQRQAELDAWAAAHPVLVLSLIHI